MKIQDLILPGALLAALYFLSRGKIGEEKAVTDISPVTIPRTAIVPVAEETVQSTCISSHTDYACQILQRYLDNTGTYERARAHFSAEELAMAAIQYRGEIAEAISDGVRSAAEITNEIISRVGEPGTRTIYYPETGQLTVTTTQPGEYRSTGGRVVPSYVEGGEPVPFEWQGEYNP